MMVNKGSMCKMTDCWVSLTDLLILWICGLPEMRHLKKEKGKCQNYSRAILQLRVWININSTTDYIQRVINKWFIEWHSLMLCCKKQTEKETGDKSWNGLANILSGIWHGQHFNDIHRGTHQNTFLSLSSLIVHCQYSLFFLLLELFYCWRTSTIRLDNCWRAMSFHVSHSWNWAELKGA